MTIITTIKGEGKKQANRDNNLRITKLDRKIREQIDKNNGVEVSLVAQNILTLIDKDVLANSKASADKNISESVEQDTTAPINKDIPVDGKVLALTDREALVPIDGKVLILANQDALVLVDQHILVPINRNASANNKPLANGNIPVLTNGETLADKDILAAMRIADIFARVFCLVFCFWTIISFLLICSIFKLLRVGNYLLSESKICFSRPINDLLVF